MNQIRRVQALAILARTPGTAQLFMHALAIFTQTALRTGRRLTER